jgi:hypothetical protein
VRGGSVPSGRWKKRTACTTEANLRDRGRRVRYVGRKWFFGTAEEIRGSAWRKHPFGEVEETYVVRDGSEPSGSWKECMNVCNGISSSELRKECTTRV